MTGVEVLYETFGRDTLGVSRLRVEPVPTGAPAYSGAVDVRPALARNRAEARRRRDLMARAHRAQAARQAPLMRRPGSSVRLRGGGASLAVHGGRGALQRIVLSGWIQERSVYGLWAGSAVVGVILGLSSRTAGSGAAPAGALFAVLSMVAAVAGAASTVRDDLTGYTARLVSTRPGRAGWLGSTMIAHQVVALAGAGLFALGHLLVGGAAPSPSLLLGVLLLAQALAGALTLGTSLGLVAVTGRLPYLHVLGATAGALLVWGVGLIAGWGTFLPVGGLMQVAQAALDTLPLSPMALGIGLSWAPAAPLVALTVWLRRDLL